MITTYKNILYLKYRNFYVI